MCGLAKAIASIVQSGTSYSWDPVAAVILTGGSIGDLDQTLGCNRSRWGETGRSTVSDGGASICVVMPVDGSRFEEILLSTLNGGKAVTSDQPPD